MKRMLFAAMLVGGLVYPLAASESPTLPACSFVTSSGVMTLQGDCVTDQTLLVPNGFTMDLGGFTVVAADPSGGHFLGAVIKNGGAVAVVRNGTIVAGNLADVCDASSPTDNRLRGVLFDGAAGKIDTITIESLNQGASGCQEGNGIEVRNAPFDGTHPNTLKVEIGHNVVSNWQKTGIVANGDVDVWIHHNFIDESSTQANLAANSLQVGFGAKALVEKNHIAGNSWCCSNTVGTAMLLFSSAPGTLVRQNELMGGNADVGIYLEADGITLDNNKIFESGEDTNAFGYDIALGDYGTGNIVTNNKAKGYATPYDGVTVGGNKSIPAPSKQ